MLLLPEDSDWEEEEAAIRRLVTVAMLSISVKGQMIYKVIDTFRKFNGSNLTAWPLCSDWQGKKLTFHLYYIQHLTWVWFPIFSPLATPSKICLKILSCYIEKPNQNHAGHKNWILFLSTLQTFDSIRPQPWTQQSWLQQVFTWSKDCKFMRFRISSSSERYEKWNQNLLFPVFDKSCCNISVYFNLLRA